MKEDKQLILNLLLPALQATRNLHDLQDLEYDAKNELVYAKFPGWDKGCERSNGFWCCNDEGCIEMHRIKRTPIHEPASSGAQKIRLSKLYRREGETSNDINGQ